MLIPENWNGRFVGIGNGGMAGILGTGWYCFAENGYIGAQSDLGTSAARNGEITVAYDEMWADYGHRAIHGMTVTAKAILEYVKGRPAEYSYFYGDPVHITPCDAGAPCNVQRSQTALREPRPQCFRHLRLLPAPQLRPLRR